MSSVYGPLEMKVIAECLTLRGRFEEEKKYIIASTKEGLEISEVSIKNLEVHPSRQLPWWDQ